MKSNVLSALRICNGQPRTRDIFVTYQDSDAGLPILHLFADWSPRNATCPVIPCKRSYTFGA